jgi:hypothetical protein
MTRAIVVPLAGRRELRLWLLEFTDTTGEPVDARLVLGKAWQGDPVPESPVMILPLDSVPDVVAALQRLVR